MRGFVRALAAASVLTLAASGAQAASSQTGAYSIGTTPVVSVVCSPDCAGMSDLNIGGYTFGAGALPTAVDIADSSGASVPYTVAQDLNGNGLSGETGEPVVRGCGTSVSLASSLVPFRATSPTSVFVRIAEGTCPGPALGGTITMHFA